MRLSIVVSAIAIAVSVSASVCSFAFAQGEPPAEQRLSPRDSAVLQDATGQVNPPGDPAGTRMDRRDPEGRRLQRMGGASMDDSGRRELMRAPQMLGSDPGRAAVTTGDYVEAEPPPGVRRIARPGGDHGSDSGSGDSSGHADGTPGHGSSGHGHHPSFSDINWYHGFFGVDAEKEKSLMWRHPDQPPPYLASLFNFALFAGVVYYFGRKFVTKSLSERKAAIMKEIEVATKTRDEAARRLADYEDRLQHIDDEIERIREDFRALGEREKERILADARERKERMLRDAQFMIDQEVRHLRIVLMKEAVDAAIDAAEQTLRARATSVDHERIAEDYLKKLSQGWNTNKGDAA